VRHLVDITVHNFKTMQKEFVQNIIEILLVARLYLNVNEE